MDRPAAPPAEASSEVPVWPPVEPVAAILLESAAPEPAAVRTEPEPETPGETGAVEPAAASQLEMQSEFLRLLAVVTSMCDHVIEYIEADRAERRLMIESLTQLSRVVADSAQSQSQSQARVATAPLPGIDIPTNGSARRERVIGGSMEAGPEPTIDLRGLDAETDFESEPEIQLGIAPEIEIELGIDLATGAGVEAERDAGIEIAVEVRGRFGDRWVDGFEICEVTTTPDGPRYRLRRHRDGVVLPELFDATSIRHVETFEQLNGNQINGSTGYWSRS